MQQNATGKGVLEIWSKFAGEHPCRSVISIKLKSNLIEIILQHGCSPVNLLHIFRAPCEDLCATYENGGKWNMETCLNMFQKK